MKALITFLLIAPLCALAQSRVNRQHSVNASIGADAVVPSGRFLNRFSGGPGATLKSEYGFSRHSSLTLSGSYFAFNGKDGPDLWLVPVQAGLRYYLGNFYLGGEAGKAFAGSAGLASGAVYTLSVGDEIVTSKNGNSVDVSVRVGSWKADTRLVYYGLRVAYEFRLR